MRHIALKTALLCTLPILLWANGLQAQSDPGPVTSNPGHALQRGMAIFEKNDQRVEALKQAETLGLQFLEKERVKHGIERTEALKVKKVHVDGVAKAHTRVQQTMGDVPVWGGEAIVHLNEDGSLFAVTDNLLSNVFVDVTPSITPELAIGLAVGASVSTYGCQQQPSLPEQPQAIGKDGLMSGVPTPEHRPADQVDLWILRREGRDHLVHRVQIGCLDGSKGPAAPVYFIDAHTGEVVWFYDNLQSQSATGSGLSLYRGTVSLITYYYAPGNAYIMENHTQRLSTWDAQHTSHAFYRLSDTNNVWDALDQQAAVDVHFGAEKAHTYFSSIHGRNGIDGVGGPTTPDLQSRDGSTGMFGSIVHYRDKYNNAFWITPNVCPLPLPDGTFIWLCPALYYGDGDGITFNPLVSLDIVGHEWTHGVTEYSTGLIYANESGALNESVSDIFGAMIERYVDGENSTTWDFGEDIILSGIGALRYMDTPHLGGQPDHYSERLVTTLEDDNGGVHTNSGIPNNAFYLLSQGGTHTHGGSMTGIGADKAAAIWYAALTSYMTQSTDFAGAQVATLNASNALYGTNSAESLAVSNAWCLVGVGTCPNADTDADTIPNVDDLCPNTFNTQYTFQDTPLMVKSTTIKTVHVTELRTAINAFRATAGLGAATWSDPTLTAKLTQVKAVHIQEMRDRLTEALTTLQCASPSYTDSVITPKITVIKAAHIEELRNAVNGKK